MDPSSENGRRGRPRAFSDGELVAAGERGPLSPRHLQDRAYARHAGRRLANLDWWENLIEDTRVPQCVLTELGRIQDDGRFGEAALWYAFSGGRLTAKQAAENIRRMRTGKVPEEGPGTLYVRLMRTVRDFRVAYPDASLRYQEGQVELVLRTIRQMHNN